MKLALLQVLVVLLAACGGSSSSSDSGIRGRAEIGICAAEAQGMDCTDAFAGEFQVRQDGRVLETVRADMDGRFELTLPPGTYVLTTDSDPLLKPVRVVVREDAFTTVTLSLDSGIR